MVRVYHQIHGLRATIGVMLLCILMPVLAHGERSEEQMNASVEAAMAAETHYAAQDYLKAVASYRKAYGFFPQPRFLRRIAQSYEKAAKVDPTHCPDAEGAWRHFLRVCGDCPKKPMALRKIDDVSRWCAQEKATQTGMKTPQAVPAASLAATEQTPEKKSHWILYTLGGAGLAVALTGAGFHLSAASTAEDISRSDLDAYQKDVDLVEGRERMAWVSYGIGAVLLTTAAFFINGGSADAVGMGHGGTTTWAWTF